MTKNSQDLEARRREQAFEDFKRDWWWFYPANRQHIHEFSAAWEILRRTRSYQLLSDRMRASTGRIDQHSFIGFLQAGRAMSFYQEMLPQSPPAPSELREMVTRWQTMIAAGWTREKNYLEAIKHSHTACVVSNGQTIHIPPTYGGSNMGVPVILPRQVASKGHTSLLVELCDIEVTRGLPLKIVHVAGPCSPTSTLTLMHKLGKPITSNLSGSVIAIQFSLDHPPQALKALVKSGLDSIEQYKSSDAPAISNLEGEENERGAYSHGPKLVVGTLNPLEAIAFFDADQSRNMIVRGFSTLIRPENIMMHLPQIRKEWIEWDSAERLRFAPGLSQDTAVEQANAAWLERESCGKPARQSTTRPIRPAEDLDNLACADCAPFYNRNRAQLPNVLQDLLSKDFNINKRIKTGLNLVSAQDDIFVPIFGR